MTEITYGITGASGQLARIAAEELRIAGVKRLVLGTRDPSSLSTTALAQDDVRRLDFDEPSTLTSGLAGVDRLLIVSTDHLSVIGARVTQHRNALQAALAAGVGHVAYTSMPNPAESSAIPFAEDHRIMEADLQRSGIDHTVLRVSWYFENLLPLLRHVASTGTWFSAAGDGRISYLARSDAGRAAARALLRADGGVIDLTGPAYQTTREIAEIFSDFLGRKIQVVDAKPSELPGLWTAAGLPPSYVATLAMTDASQRDGRFSDVSGAVAELTGHEPLGWHDFLSANLEHLLPSVVH